MNRVAKTTLALVAVALVAAAAVLPGLASAEGPNPTAQAQARAKAKTLADRPQGERLRDAGQREKPLAVAIALGAIEGDEEAYIDLHAAVGAERQGGNLRFWTEDDGYYNGGIRTVTITGQNVHAEGAGPLWKPDGTRVPVRFSMDLNGGSNRVSITVKGRELEYTLEGKVEGFVFVGPPPQQ
jgi:hypothetical protein